MKRFVLLSIALLTCFGLSAQAFDYGNTWYQSNPNQPYLKLIVSQTGVYRVSAADLQAAGYDPGSIPTRNLRLIFRGREVPIYVSSVGGQLNFVEFFGRRNDGRLDSIMYRDPFTGIHKPNLQPNIETSIYTDEAAYFLTWGSLPGQRMFRIFDPTYQLYTALPTVRHRVRTEYPDGVISVGGGGAYEAVFSLNTDYITGEGHVGPGFSPNTPRTVRLTTPDPVNTGTPVKVEARVFGRSTKAHLLELKLNGDRFLDTTIGNLSNLDISNNANVYIKTYRREVNANLLGTTDVTFEAKNTNTDNNNICWTAVTYDRAPNLRGDSTLLIAEYASASKQLLRLTNVAGSDSIYVYDPVNQVRNVGLIQNGTGQVIIQNFTNTRDLYVTTERGILKPRIETTRLNRLFEGAAEYVIITNRGLQASAEAMAIYRDTATVTPVNGVKVVYVDEIYDEFGYGSVTPWAIKRFCKYAIDNWNIRPNYFLLWGKGLRNLRGVTSDVVVPTFGQPSSDFEFVGHFDQNSTLVNPEAAIGRINLRNEDQGFVYLDKVNEYEHKGWEPWMKEGVFLGGGASANEQNDIETAFEFALDIYENEPFGGTPFYFQKRSSNIVIDPDNASYHDRIGSGVNLIHFFGHSSQNILDISIKEPELYDNFGRYPMMVAMGCYGGEFSGGMGFTFGERWMVSAGRGAIGYLANSSAGYLSPLSNYAEVLYRIMFDEGLGQPIGQSIQRTMTDYINLQPGINFRNHGRQMNLQGDPAVILHYPTKVDLEVNETSVFFTPENFSAQEDSFTMHIIVSNFGRVPLDSFALTVDQRLPNGQVLAQVRARLPMVAYRDTFSYVLQNPVGNLMTGQNTFDVVVDADEEHEEYDETNNRINYRQLVPGNVPAALFPPEFAIIPDNQVELRASAFFMSRDDQVPYIFEIDTTDQFNSPLLQTSGTVLGRATLVTWQPSLTLQDSGVYFWRVRLRDVTPVSWSTSSFKHIANRNGWAQSRFGQFQKNQFQNLRIDRFQQEWDFENYGVDFEFYVQSGSGLYRDFRNGGLEADPDIYGYSGNMLVMVVIDQYTLERLSFSYDGLQAQVLDIPSELPQLPTLIDAVKPGDYVVVASFRNPLISTWPEATFQALKKIGVSEDIRYVTDNGRFLVMGRKGATSATEVYAPNAGNSQLNITTTLTSNFERGGVTSTVIGPSTRWESLIWDWRSKDRIVQEQTTTSVIGIRRDGTDSLLLADLARGTHALTQIDANRFPFLRLQGDMVDSIRLTAPQIDNWHVLYDPAPDAAVDLLTDFAFESDTVFEGQEVFLRMAARNISNTDMDSVNVLVKLTRADRSQLVIDTLRIAPLRVGAEPVVFETRFPSTGKNLSGEVDLTVELNHEQTPLEQYTFNNLYVQPFQVFNDRQSPVLDVTFDGKHIIDGDVVSPTPEILVEVNDENAYVPISDSNAFTLKFLRGTNTVLDTGQIFITGDPRVEWQPAELPANKARLYFRPGKVQPLADGEYTLRVQGRDQSGNTAGGGPDYYEISFRVENQSTLTHVLNYPNPFSTSTRFVYTLTGAELPEVFQVHIFTVSGKLVKVIDLKALGDVFFGRNITNYAWDGTDEYGDALANGVYLYRVVTKMASGVSDPELRDTNTSQYFNNGFGKMVLIR
jgi:hypothetical protein